MKSLWEGIKLGVRTLFSNPVGYLTDPVGSTTEKYRTELIATDLPADVIQTRLDDFRKSGGILTDVGDAYGSVTKAVGSAVKSVGNILNFTGKNLTLILIVVAAIIALYYFLMFRKATS